MVHVDVCAHCGPGWMTVGRVDTFELMGKDERLSTGD